MTDYQAEDAYSYNIFAGKYPLKVFRDGTYQTVPITVPPKCVPEGASQSPADLLFGSDCDNIDIHHPQITGEGTGNIRVEECEVEEDGN